MRYLTHRFHAKIYIFDDAALLGSSNLTDGGLRANREATIYLDLANDHDAVEELRALFAELWESARVLTDEILKTFTAAHRSVRRSGPSPDAVIEKAVGRAEPVNIDVASAKKGTERIFLERLRRQIYEEYRPAFTEVTHILAAHDVHRLELTGVGTSNETNRFLNWVRLTEVIGDEVWQNAPLRSEAERRSLIAMRGAAWVQAEDHKIPNVYSDWLQTVIRIFGSPEPIQAASKEELMTGLMSLHAFNEQSRFVKGGAKNLPSAFWKANGNNDAKVKECLIHLLHGHGDFTTRLHDILYDSALKLRQFGLFSALELYGTVKPDECPPMNGRMAKALRYLGFDVKAT